MKISRCASQWLILLLLFSGFSYADKAIYRCKDTSGQFVFQQYPCAENRLAANNDVLAVWKELRALSSKGKYTLSLLTGDIDALRVCEAEMELFGEQLKQLMPRLRNFSEQTELVEAYQFLQACGDCRSSAVANCAMADHFLQRAAQRLSRVAH